MDTVTVWVALVTFNGELNVSAVGETVLMGAMPVPVSEAVCGLPGSESLTEIAATRVPAAVGLKLTLIVQLAPAAKLAPQVVVLVKSPAFAPVMEILLIVTVVMPTLVSVVV